MRRVLLLAIALVTAACASDVTATDDPPPRDASEERALLIQKIEDFNRSIREGDKEGYADVFVDDFVFTWSRNGQIYDKETILPNVVPTPDHRPIVDELLIRRYGDSAVLNYRVRMKEEDAGVRVTFSCGRVGDEWKVLASQSTPIVVESDADGETAE